MRVEKAEIPMTSAPEASSSHDDAICSIVLVSDTHGRHRELMMPTSGFSNVLICAGDFTRFGRKSDAIDFNDWLGEQPMAHKLVVLGNHEANAEWVDAASSILSNATLLRDQTVRLPNGLAVHGTEFYWPVEADRAIFQPPYGRIPGDTDVLVCHGPCAGHADGGMGCVAMLHHAERVRPLLVVSGHIHQARGVSAGTGEHAGITYVNASNAPMHEHGRKKKPSKKPGSHAAQQLHPPFVCELDRGAARVAVVEHARTAALPRSAGEEHAHDATPSSDRAADDAVDVA